MEMIPVFRKIDAVFIEEYKVDGQKFPKISRRPVVGVSYEKDSQDYHFVSAYEKEVVVIHSGYTEKLLGYEYDGNKEDWLNMNWDESSIYVRGAMDLLKKKKVS